MRICSCIVIVADVLCYRCRVCAKLEKHVRDNGIEFCIYRRRRATPLGGVPRRGVDVSARNPKRFTRVRTHNRAMLEV